MMRIIIVILAVTTVVFGGFAIRQTCLLNEVRVALSQERQKVDSNVGKRFARAHKTMIDENGTPVRPPEGFQPPTDENGNPVRPPEGFQPPTDENGNPVPRRNRRSMNKVATE